MDLGIKGRRALVCGASRGLGFACATSLARAGVSLWIVARDQGQLNRAAAELRSEFGVEVTTIATDLSSAEGCKHAINTLPDLDILVTNCGGAPPGDFLSFSREDWIAALELNMLSAIELIRACLGGMKQRGFGRIVNITNVAMMGGYPDLPLSSGATAGLVGVTASLAKDAARSGVIINNLLPGRFETERLARNIAHDMDKLGESEGDIRKRRLIRQSVQRFGDPSELGDLCAFLCGANAGYIVGQNITIDGGSHA